MNGKSWPFRIPRRPTLVIYPGEFYPDEEYTTHFNFPYKVVSLDHSIGSDEVAITYVNQQDTVTVNKYAIDDSGVKDLQANSDNTQVFNIFSESWFSGPVLGMTLRCDDCTSDVTLKSKISLKNRVTARSPISPAREKNAYALRANSSVRAHSNLLAPIRALSACPSFSLCESYSHSLALTLSSGSAA